MTNTTETRVVSDIAMRVAFYSLGVAVFVFVAMLLMAGVHPW